MRVIGAALKRDPKGEKVYAERLKRYLKLLGVEKIILVNTLEQKSSEENIFREFSGESMDGIGIVHLPVDLSGYNREKLNFLERAMNSADLSVKVKLVEVIEDSINRYLEELWDYPERVNSDLTDSIFKAKHALISDLIYEYEKVSWIGPNNAIINSLGKLPASETLAILVEPERRYYIKEKLESLG